MLATRSRTPPCSCTMCSSTWQRPPQAGQGKAWARASTAAGDATSIARSGVAPGSRVLARNRI